MEDVRSTFSPFLYFSSCFSVDWAGMYMFLQRGRSSMTRVMMEEAWCMSVYFTRV